VRKLLISKINLIDIHFGNFLAILINNRNTHKLFKYDVAVTKLNCLIVFIVICTKNFWKAAYGAIPQQSDHILSFKQAFNKIFLYYKMYIIKFIFML